MGTILQILSVIEVLLWAIRKVSEAHWRAVQQYLDAHPPMSDEEFLSQCSPGVSPEIALRVRAIVSESLGIDYERVYPHTNVVDCC